MRKLTGIKLPCDVPVQTAFISKFPNQITISWLSMAASELVSPLAASSGKSLGADVRRRDFLNIAAVSFAGVGGIIALAPLLVQMSPSADVLAQATTEIDISKVEVGQRIKALWRKQPIFVAHLTPKDISAAEAVPLSSLRDPQTLEKRTKPGHLNWLVVIGVCTHLGCIPLGTDEGDNRGKFGGYFCPCHGSQYDTAARIRQGPAPKNLYLPPYEFKSAAVVAVG